MKIILVLFFKVWRPSDNVGNQSPISVVLSQMQQGRYKVISGVLASIILVDELCTIGFSYVAEDTYFFEFVLVSYSQYLPGF